MSEPLAPLSYATPDVDAWETMPDGRRVCLFRRPGRFNQSAGQIACGLVLICCAVAVCSAFVDGLMNDRADVSIVALIIAPFAAIAVAAAGTSCLSQALRVWRATHPIRLELSDTTLTITDDARRRPTLVISLAGPRRVRLYVKVIRLGLTTAPYVTLISDGTHLFGEWMQCTLRVGQFERFPYWARYWVLIPSRIGIAPYLLPMTKARRASHEEGT